MVSSSSAGEGALCSPSSSVSTWRRSTAAEVLLSCAETAGCKSDHAAPARAKEKRLRGAVWLPAVVRSDIELVIGGKPGQDHDVREESQADAPGRDEISAFAAGCCDRSEDGDNSATHA